MKTRLWGAILLVLGILFLFQVTGVYNFGLAFWPVLLLLLGVVMIWESIGYGFISWFSIGLGLWVGSIGLFGILSRAGAGTVSGGDIARYGWPFLLIAIGLSIIIGDKIRVAGGFRSVGGSGDDKWRSYIRTGHIGDLHHGRSSWVLDKDHEFAHGIGEVLIDLTTAEIRPGTHRVLVRSGIGDLTVKVPGGVNVEAQASVGLGELELFGDKRAGFTGLSLERSVTVEGAEATIQLEARLGIGDLDVMYRPD